MSVGNSSADQATQQQDHRLLKAVLRTSAVAELLYFTGSHWFFHHRFFNALGITGPDLDSPFVISQLQIIGLLVLGYSLLGFIIASDPVRYRAVLATILLVGVGCIAIFVGSVAAGTLPAPFLVNAVLLAIQIGLGVWLFPKDLAKSERDAQQFAAGATALTGRGELKR
jgi:hypothetical protein